MPRRSVEHLPPSEIFGRRLRETRQARGKTQRDLAGDMSREGRPMRKEALLRIEKGTRGVSLDEAVALAALLHVSLAHLLSPPDGTYIGVTGNRGFDGAALRNFLLFGDPMLGVTSRGRRVRQDRYLVDEIVVYAQALLDARKGKEGVGEKAARDKIYEAVERHRMRMAKVGDDDEL